MTEKQVRQEIILVKRIKTKYAGVAELADEQDSGSCGSNTVWVQVPSSAVIDEPGSQKRFLGFF